MTRQDRFEAYFADSRGLEPGTITQYRFNTQDGYRLPKLAMAYRDFCAGVGAVQVKLPDFFDPDGGGSWAYWAADVERSLFEAGVGMVL